MLIQIKSNRLIQTTRSIKECNDVNNVYIHVHLLC